MDESGVWREVLQREDCISLAVAEAMAIARASFDTDNAREAEGVIRWIGRLRDRKIRIDLIIDHGSLLVTNEPVNLPDYPTATIEMSFRDMITYHEGKLAMDSLVRNGRATVVGDMEMLIRAGYELWFRPGDYSIVDSLAGQLAAGAQTPV